MSDTHKIVWVRGHYELQDSAGNLLSSGDTWNECYNDLIEMLTEHAQMEDSRMAVAV